MSFRELPPELRPITHEGVRYSTTRGGDGGRHPHSGFVDAYDVGTGRKLWELEVFHNKPEFLGGMSVVTWLAMTAEGTLLVGEESDKIHEVCLNERRVLRTYRLRVAQDDRPDAMCARLVEGLEPEFRQALEDSVSRLKSALDRPGAGTAELTAALEQVLGYLIPLVPREPSLELAYAEGQEKLEQMRAGTDVHRLLYRWFQALARLILWPTFTIRSQRKPAPELRPPVD